MSRSCGGFSVVEAIVGFAVLGLVFTGLMSFTGVQRKALTRSGDRSEAARITLSELEKAKAPLADTNLFKANHLRIRTRGPIVATSQVPGKTNRYRVTITQTRLTGTDRLIRFTARATWGSRDTLTVGTLVACP